MICFADWPIVVYFVLSFLCHIWTYYCRLSPGAVGCLSVLSFCSLILSLHLCHLMTAFLFSLTFLITLIFHSFFYRMNWFSTFVCLFLFFALLCIFFVVLFFASSCPSSFLCLSFFSLIFRFFLFPFFYICSYLSLSFFILSLYLLILTTILAPFYVFFFCLYFT